MSQGGRVLHPRKEEADLSFLSSTPTQRLPHLPRHFLVGGVVCRQIGRLGTTEAEEISMNQEIKMQAAAFKNKKQGSPANEG